jgi:hypothetical protein
LTHQLYEATAKVVNKETRVGRVAIFKSKSRAQVESRDQSDAGDKSASNFSSAISTRNASTNLQSKSSSKSSNLHNSTRILPSLTVVFGNRFVIHSGIHSRNALNEDRVLVIKSNSKDRGSQSVINIVQSHRIPFSVLNFGSKLNAEKVTLTKVISNDGKQIAIARFSVLVFGSVSAYSQLSDLDVRLVTKYCQEFQVGLIIFTLSSPLRITKLSAVSVKYDQKVKEIKLNPKTPFLRLLRNTTSSIPIDHVAWSTLVSSDSSHLPVLVGINAGLKPVNLALFDNGHKDGIKKIWLGGDPQNWIIWLIFLDSVFYLSNHFIHIPLERYIQVDIDDIFTGKSGIRLKHPDITSLISTQNWLAKRVHGFKFYLGFSGDTYQQGTPEEQMGARCLIGNASHFQWFGHMPTHLQPHKFDTAQSLVKQMERNRQFARKYNLSLVPGYTVTPHHSGVYPVHLPLFKALKVFNVTVTSTEGYPSHDYKERKGFTFKDIKVLPRQTCTLFTTINFYSQYRNGHAGLISAAEGGTVFQTLLANQFSIFMTHMSNYGSDRLANQLWRTLVGFVMQWTNIKLRAVPPLELAKLYFNAYPGDVEPMWKPPCTNPKHKAIWSAKKPCNTLPNVMILGPTKSGVSVLHKWLAMHPMTLLKGNASWLSVGSTKFFTEKYLSGLDWYMNQFAEPEEGYIVVDSMSGSAMANRSTVTKIKALLPQAKLIFMLHNFMSLAQTVCQVGNRQKCHTCDCFVCDVFCV